MAITESETKQKAADAIDQRSGDSPVGVGQPTAATWEADRADSDRNGPCLTEPDRRLAPSLNLYCSLRMPPVDDAD